MGDYERAVDYVHSLGELGWKLGLERFAALCARLGNPQEQFRSVHIAGTNGKGSTAAMVSAILKSAGYKVGSYYSPFVYDIRERVVLNGEMIPESDFARLVNFIRPHAEAVAQTEHGHPTEFEFKTALGFVYFAEQKVDFAVLEVGLGGRLDATNIVNPLVSAITNVAMDHMEHLGNTISEIAAEKAGIIKRNGHLVTAVTDPEAFEVIRRTCEERASRLWRVRIEDGTGTMEQVLPDASRITHYALRITDLHLRMPGDFQRINAALAVGIAEALQTKGVVIPESAIRSGLETAHLPGRLEVLREKPTLLIDGAHNPDAARNLAQALEKWFKYEKLILVMGMVTGHSVEDVVGILAPLADKFIATAPSSPRAASAASIADAARSHCPDVSTIEPVSEAVRHALDSASENDLILVTGSFYTIGEVPRGMVNG